AGGGLGAAPGRPTGSGGAAPPGRPHAGGDSRRARAEPVSRGLAGLSRAKKLATAAGRRGTEGRMKPNATRDTKREEQLGEVLAEWLEAAEQGLPPDESAYLRRYPEFATELAQCFADWKHFPRPQGAAERTWTIPELALPESGRLGDFRILREVGR